MIILPENTVNYIAKHIYHLFNICLNITNQVGLKILPFLLKEIISITIVSILCFIFFCLFLFSIVFVYFFFLEIIKTSKKETIKTKLINTGCIIFNNIIHPVQNEKYITLLKKYLLIISIVGVFIVGLKSILPFIIIAVICNDYVCKKFNYIINQWLFIFLVIMLLVYSAINVIL